MNQNVTNSINAFNGLSPAGKEFMLDFSATRGLFYNDVNKILAVFRNSSNRQEGFKKLDQTQRLIINNIKVPADKISGQEQLKVVNLSNDIVNQAKNSKGYLKFFNQFLSNIPKRYKHVAESAGKLVYGNVKAAPVNNQQTVYTGQQNTRPQVSQLMNQNNQQNTQNQPQQPRQTQDRNIVNIPSDMIPPERTDDSIPPSEQQNSPVGQTSSNTVDIPEDQIPPETQDNEPPVVGFDPSQLSKTPPKSNANSNNNRPIGNSTSIQSSNNNIQNRNTTSNNPIQNKKNNNDNVNNNAPIPNQDKQQPVGPPPEENIPLDQIDQMAPPEDDQQPNQPPEDIDQVPTPPNQNPQDDSQQAKAVHNSVGLAQNAVNKAGKKYTKKRYKHHKKYVSYKDKAKKALQQHPTDVKKGMALYDSLTYQGQKYMKTCLRNFAWNNGLLDKYKENKMDNLNPKEQKAQQQINDTKNSIRRSFNDGHILSKGQPLDSKQRTKVDNFLKMAPTAVIQYNLIQKQLRARKEHKQEALYKKKELLSREINLDKKTGALKKNADSIAQRVLPNIDLGSRNYLHINTKLAGSDFLHYITAKKGYDALYKNYVTDYNNSLAKKMSQKTNYDKYKLANRLRTKVPKRTMDKFCSALAWNMRRPFQNMNDIRGGFVTYGRTRKQVPKANPKVANAIDKFMSDAVNRSVLASGALNRRVGEYNFKNSAQNINAEQNKAAIKHLSPAQEEPMRQFFLSLKPRSRRYFGAIARYASKDFYGTLRVISSTPRDQLTSNQRYMSEHLYAMSHGKTRVRNKFGKGYWRQTGRPLPPDERHKIRATFLSQGWQPYFCNGDVNKIVNDLQKGAKIRVPGFKHFSDQVESESVDRACKLYQYFVKRGDFQGLQYLTKSVQDYAMHPKTFERELYANEKDQFAGTNLRRNLSIHERKDWRNVQGILEGKKANDYDEMVQVTDPSPTPKLDKAMVDSFLTDPRNRRALYSQHHVIQNTMRLEKQYTQYLQNHGINTRGLGYGNSQGYTGNFLRRVGSLLRGSSRSAWGIMTGIGSNKGAGSSRYSRSRFGTGHDMYVHDLRRDQPGQDI